MIKELIVIANILMVVTWGYPVEPSPGVVSDPLAVATTGDLEGAETAWRGGGWHHGHYGHHGHHGHRVHYGHGGWHHRGWGHHGGWGHYG